MKGNVIEQSRMKKRSQMDLLLSTGLNKTARLSHVEKNIGDVINVVPPVKKAVASALQAVPIAAVAWTGVCLALKASSPPHSTFDSDMLGLSDSGQRDEDESRRNYASRPDDEMVLEFFKASPWADI